MNVGDVVKMKSGGPAMTVVEVMPGMVSCAWFRVTPQLAPTAMATHNLIVVYHELAKDSFPVDALEVVANG
jgi:uncharacterized protein YodC (DUF2158 family)